MAKTKKPKKGFLDGYETYDTSTGFGNTKEWGKQFHARMGHKEATAAVAEEDPLTIMGFDSLPTQADLDKRFRDLVFKHHPDHGGTAEMFKKIHAAWSLLKERY
jgi:hypothetical protein